MGADLYIKKLPREVQYKHCGFSTEAVKDGYFRDCYNSGGLFAVMSANLGRTFSWWQLVGRKDFGFNKNGELPAKNVKKFRNELVRDVEVFSRKKVLYYAEWDLQTGKDKRGKKVSADEVKEYQEWANGLLLFLDVAIENKSSIIFSV